ncbi:hypothetical protein Syun_002752 [Stephania yunnanensis]|uniref:Uncharacterized protein n=1 Tax=Stephania yunnanensis TaxID=152371 RepID=A0AAP0LIA8_9MAGN
MTLEDYLINHEPMPLVMVHGSTDQGVVYTNELENKISRLEEENKRLKEEKVIHCFDLSEQFAVRANSGAGNEISAAKNQLCFLLTSMVTLEFWRDALGVALRSLVAFADM